MSSGRPLAVALSASCQRSGTHTVFLPFCVRKLGRLWWGGIDNGAQQRQRNFQSRQDRQVHQVGVHVMQGILPKLVGSAAGFALPRSREIAPAISSSKATMLIVNPPPPPGRLASQFDEIEPQFAGRIHDDKVIGSATIRRPFLPLAAFLFFGAKHQPAKVVGEVAVGKVLGRAAEVFPLPVAPKTQTPVRASARRKPCAVAPIPQHRLRVEVRAGRPGDLVALEILLPGGRIWQGKSKMGLGCPLGHATGGRRSGGGFRGGTALMPGYRGQAPDCQSRAARLWRVSNRRTVGQGSARAARLCVGVFRGGKPLPGGHARNEAGILRDGFGVPSARNIACDV